MAGLKDEDADARQSLVEALANIKTYDTYQALEALVENGVASYYVEAVAAKALGGIAAASLDERQKKEFFTFASFIFLNKLFVVMYTILNKKIKTV